MDERNNNKKSVIILTTTYNDWLSLALLLPQIDNVLFDMGFLGKIIIVDDGSNDNTGKSNLSGLDLKSTEFIDIVELAVNQGNQRSQALGVAYIANNIKGDYLVLIDGDNEDSPKYIKDLINKCNECNNQKIIFAERTQRQETFIFRSFYKLYQRLYYWLTGTRINIGNYSVCPMSLVRRLSHVPGLWSHFPAAIIKSRLPYGTIKSRREKRLVGKSKMNIFNLVSHAFSAFAIHAELISARLMFVAVLAVTCIGILILGLIAMRLFTNIPVNGWTSIIILQLGLALMQIISAAATIMLIVLSVRQQMPMLPLYDFNKFIYNVFRIYQVNPDSNLK